VVKYQEFCCVHRIRDSKRGVGKLLLSGTIRSVITEPTTKGVSGPLRAILHTGTQKVVLRGQTTFACAEVSSLIKRTDYTTKNKKKGGAVEKTTKPLPQKVGVLAWGKNIWSTSFSPLVGPRPEMDLNRSPVGIWRPGRGKKVVEH